MDSLPDHLRDHRAQFGGFDVRSPALRIVLDDGQRCSNVVIDEIWIDQERGRDNPGRYLQARSRKATSPYQDASSAEGPYSPGTGTSFRRKYTESWPRWWTMWLSTKERSTANRGRLKISLSPASSLQSFP